MHIFKMNEFFRGISLPQPEMIESLEKKLPKQALSIPNLLDFLKVIIFYINHFKNVSKYTINIILIINVLRFLLNYLI